MVRQPHKKYRIATVNNSETAHQFHRERDCQRWHSHVDFDAWVSRCGLVIRYTEDVEKELVPKDEVTCWHCKNLIQHYGEMKDE